MSANRQRCLGCNNWPSEWAMVGRYYPIFAIPGAPRGFHAVYFLCPRCTDKVKKGGRIARRVTNNVEAYLNDELRDALAAAGVK